MNKKKRGPAGSLLRLRHFSDSMKATTSSTFFQFFHLSSWKKNYLTSMSSDKISVTLVNSLDIWCKGKKSLLSRLFIMVGPRILLLVSMTPSVLEGIYGIYSFCRLQARKPRIHKASKSMLQMGREGFKHPA